MALMLRNSLTRQEEEFHPLESGKVRIYSCGPTVYNYQHIGNFRTFTWVDLLHRYLEYKGYEVTLVLNLTDVDDKIIRDSRKAGKSREEFTQDFEKAFFDDWDSLGLQRADRYPRATEHISDMVDMVKQLVDKGMAYEKDGNYFFKINSFPNYGELANLDMEGLKPGARVASDEYEKESVSDFALWKKWTPGDGDIFWETDIGKGRPGWHLECSVMSMKYLGDQFDIHCGGVDLLFPHHTNEIAQSEGTTGHRFVNYWLHGEHLIVEGRKMSKSLGNYFTLRDILEQGYSGRVVRYVLLATHYRQQLNFTFDGLEAARASLERYNDFISNLETFEGGLSNGKAADLIEQAVAEFEGSLDDDLNISGALAAVFEFIRGINVLKTEKQLSTAEKDEVLATIRKFDTVLNLHLDTGDIDAQVEEMIERRNEAREAKDFAKADKIRNDLDRMGIVLEDTPQGVRWKRKL
jgi:cysteinyl-tRNA synthetase